MPQQVRTRTHKNAPNKHQQPPNLLNPAIIHSLIGKALHGGRGCTTASKQALYPPCLPKQFHSTKCSQEPLAVCQTRSAPNKHQQLCAAINSAIIYCPVGTALHRGGGGTTASKLAFQPPCLFKYSRNTEHSQQPSGSLPRPKSAKPAVCQARRMASTAKPPKHTRKFWLTTGNASRMVAVHALTTLADNPVGH
jgi:hypothetical protein